jgi:hypothetical protein
VAYWYLEFGAVAQLGEHLLCKQGVRGSIPLRSIEGISHADSKFHVREVAFRLGTSRCLVPE